MRQLLLQVMNAGVNGGEVTCTQGSKRSSEHVQETNLPTF